VTPEGDHAVDESAEDLAVIVAAKALGESGQTAYVFPASLWSDSDGPDMAEIQRIAKGAWVLELPSIGALEAALDTATTIFVSPLGPGVFATSEALADGPNVRVISKRAKPTQEPEAPVSVAEQAMVNKALTHVKLFKTDEERFVLGAVLEPDTVDSQKDFYNAESIRAAAHSFMEHYQALGKQHSEIVTGKLKILESYLAPVGFTLGEETITKGTWLLAIRVADDDLWDQVKKGEFTGFSIGGAAYRNAKPFQKPEVP
jgi:hypothetical protein